MRERRLVYHESPLVVFSTRTKLLTSTHSNSMAKPLQTIQHLPAQLVTPSPTSREGNEVAGSMIRQNSVGKRQLFRSPHETSSNRTQGRTGSTSGLKHQESESNIVSPGRRRLFASSLPADVVEERHRSSRRGAGNVGDTSKAPPNQGTAHAVKLARRRGVEMPLFGIKSWESVASMNSTPVSPKSSSSSMPSIRFRPPLIKHNSTKATIPQELVSLLALPVTKEKSAKHLPPKTHEEVLRKAEARRKKGISPRHLPPRRCKSRMSSVSLMEESDDDLYFDTIMHTAMSRVPNTVSTLKRAQSSTSPMADSEPTDTNLSRQDDDDDQGEKLVVTPVKRKSGRPCKIKVAAKKPTRVKTSVVRKRPSRSGELVSQPQQGSPPSTLEKRRRHQGAIVAARGDSPLIDGQHSDSNRDEEAVLTSSQPVVKVRTSTSRSVGRSTSRIHKVRFAPTTTTFSLEIRVKTSARSRRGNREKVSRPTLSESTVQTIANEITQAYLAQEARAVDESGEDPSDEEEYDTGSTSYSDQGNLKTSDIRPLEKHSSQQRLKDAPAPRVPEVALDDGHDTRSVASEITMDVELLRGEREIAVPKGPVIHQSVPFSAAVPTTNDQDAGPQTFPRNDYDDYDNIDESCLKKRRQEESFSLNGPSGASHSTLASKQLSRQRTMTNPTGGPRAGLTTSGEIRQGDKRNSSQQRRRRWLRSTDSLAGCSLASLNSVKSFSERVPSVASVQKVPGEVSVSTSRTETLQPLSRKVENVVPLRHEVAVQPSSMRPFDGICGKCSGCRLTFDCLSCKKCISHLQGGRRIDQGTGCLRRVCRVYGAQPMDTLARTASSSDDVLPTSAVPCLHPQQAKEDDGDASMSYFSDTGSVYSTASKMRRSRAARFWSRQWAQQRKFKMTSDSIAENNIAALDDPNDSLAGNSKKRGRGKNAKSALHDLELPMPTDGSVASLLASRRSLRALMQYDEADQDWI